MDACEERRTVRLETDREEGRSYVPNVDGPNEPGSYDLRYTRNGKRRWEAVGSDPTLALQEQRARQRALETRAVSVTVTALPKRKLRDAVAEFLSGKENRNWGHILTAFGDWWGWEKHVEDFQRLDFKAFAKHVASLSPLLSPLGPVGWWKMQSNRPLPSDLLRSVLGERLKSHGLTYREEQIVELILHGLSNKAIAAGCHITEQTVKDHLKHVYRKMGVHQRTAVIAKLLQF